MKLCASLISMVACCLFPLVSPADEKILYFGAVATDIPAVMHQRLSPLSNYLSEALKRPVHLKLSPDLKTAVQQSIDGSIDLAYLTPMAYVQARQSGNVKLVAKAVVRGKSTCQLMIVVKDESAIKTINDLKGKSFAFGDETSFLQRAIVSNSGIQLNQLKEYQFLGHYDNVAHAVLNDDFDAGILRDTTALRWQTKGLRILHQSRVLPAFNITARKNLAPEVYTQIKRALLALEKSNHQHRHILIAIDPGHDGFIDADDKEYDSAQVLARPYLNAGVNTGSGELGK